MLSRGIEASLGLPWPSRLADGLVAAGMVFCTGNVAYPLLSGRLLQHPREMMERFHSNPDLTINR